MPQKFPSIQCTSIHPILVSVKFGFFSCLALWQISCSTKYLNTTWRPKPSVCGVMVYSVNLICKFIRPKYHQIPDSLQWRHNERDGISNHRFLDCLLNRLFGCRSNKASKIRITGLCEGNPPVTGGFPSQRTDSNAENVFIWCSHHAHKYVEWNISSQNHW